MQPACTICTRRNSAESKTDMYTGIPSKREARRREKPLQLVFLSAILAASSAIFAVKFFPRPQIEAPLCSSVPPVVIILEVSR